MPKREPIWEYHALHSAGHLGRVAYPGSRIRNACRECDRDLCRISYWTNPDGVSLCSACAGEAWWEKHKLDALTADQAASRSQRFCDPKFKTYLEHLVWLERSGRKPQPSPTKEDIEEAVAKCGDPPVGSYTAYTICSKCHDLESLAGYWCSDCRQWFCLMCFSDQGHACRMMNQEQYRHVGKKPEPAVVEHDEHRAFLMDPTKEGRFYLWKQRAMYPFQIMAAGLGRTYRMWKQRWTHWLELVGISIGLLVVGFGMTHIRGCVERRWAEDAVTYEAKGECKNCGTWFGGGISYPFARSEYARIPLGVKFEEAPCPKCGFKTLEKRKDD